MRDPCVSTAVMSSARLLVYVVREKVGAAVSGHRRVDTKRSAASILVADSSAQFADLLCHVIRAAGYSAVHRANDSELVWESLTRKRIDLAVLDLNLGPRTAAEIVVALRRSAGPSAHVPIIGLTAVIRRPELNAALLAGINDVLTKPLSPDTLLARIDALLVPQYNELPGPGVISL